MKWRIYKVRITRFLTTRWAIERGMFLHLVETFDDARQYVVEQIAEANSLQPKRWL